MKLSPVIYTQMPLLGGRPLDSLLVQYPSPRSSKGRLVPTSTHLAQLFGWNTLYPQMLSNGAGAAQRIGRVLGPLDPQKQFSWSKRSLLTVLTPGEHLLCVSRELIHPVPSFRCHPPTKSFVELLRKSLLKPIPIRFLSSLNHFQKRLPHSSGSIFSALNYPAFTHIVSDAIIFPSGLIGLESHSCHHGYNCSHRVASLLLHTATCLKKVGRIPHPTDTLGHQFTVPSPSLSQGDAERSLTNG